MKYESGFIKIYRSILDWEWYNDLPCRVLFLHCLIKANWKDKNYQGNIIKRGSFITGYGKLSEETGLSIQKIRTALKKLKLTNELTSESTTQGTVIQVVKYLDYQQTTIELTNEQQTSNKRATTTKEYKEYKELNISFDHFWDLYDKKVGNKEKLSKKWNKLNDKERQAIMDHIPKYKNSIPDKKFRKNPDTFLNNKSWNDEVIFSQNVKKQEFNPHHYLQCK